jgi:hypothetical protein
MGRKKWRTNLLFLLHTRGYVVSRELSMFSFQYNVPFKKKMKKGSSRRMRK